MSTYYKDQLAKIEANSIGYPATIKLSKNQKSTNWLSLNDESASELFKWLKDNYTIKEEITTFGGNWSIEDIKGKSLDVHGIILSDEQATNIANKIQNNHDASIGINWDVINSHVEMFIQDNNL